MVNAKNSKTRAKDKEKEDVEKDLHIGNNDIAVIGIACKFPDAGDYNEFWNNLINEVNSIKRIPRERWDTGKNGACADEDLGWENEKITKYCGILENIDKFDNTFFNISPREAANMDPQQRILLEEAWHCIEDSGVPLVDLQRKKTSVYTGVTGNDYNLLALVNGEDVDSYASLGNFECLLSNRISHFFGFTGESISLDTACASSLVAVHQAKQSLLMGGNDYAIAAGVCLAYHPWRYITFSKSNMMSTDGQCKAFDADANGFVQGEGVGVLLLQRLEDAVKAGNHIYGIIKGTSVNHCGNTKTIAAPSMTAQRDLILEAFEDAKIGPETVNYIETHGTGTSLGDPIEVEALTHVYRSHTTKNQICKIGSVKSNIGHLASAAGVAGIIKVLLMMKYRKIVKSLNIKSLNPLLDWERTPFSVATESTDWVSAGKGLPLRAGVSSFGFGGVNAHVLLESHEDKAKSKPSGEGESSLFALSAMTKNSLKGHAERWISFCESNEFEQYNLQDICSTVLTGRKSFNYRAGRIVKTKDDIKTFLKEFNKESIEATENRKWILNIGENAWESSDKLSELRKVQVFASKLDKVLEVLTAVDLEKKVIDGFNSGKWDQSFLPVYKFIINYTLAQTLLELGFKPNAVSGEKEGIWASLAVAGIVRLEDVFLALSGQKALNQLELLSPKKPFYDRVSGKTIMPYSFDAEYVKELTEGVGIRKDKSTKSKNSGDLLTKDVLEYYIGKARKLKKSQFTFKKYLEEWDAVLKEKGLGIDQLLSNDEFLTSRGDEFGLERLLLVLIIVSSLIKLNRKWDLAENILVEEEKFYEMVYLLVDEVMSKEMLVDLVMDKSADFAIIAKKLDENQYKIKNGTKYSYLNKRNSSIQEIRNFEGWINTARSSTSPIGLEGVEVFDIGVKKSVSLVSMDLEEKPFDSLKKAILNLWLNGANIKWEVLYTEGTYRKLPLPVYAYDRESFWIKPKEVKKQIAGLHPMIDVNESTLEAQVFKKTLRVKDFYVGDHVVDKKVILPGVAYLEMVRAAGELAARKPVKMIKDVLWVNPIVMDKTERDTYVGLYPERNYVTYEVYTENEGNRVIHSSGKLFYESNSESGPIKYSVEEIRNKCNFHINKKDCYQKVFSDFIGFDYGPGFQVTEEAFGGVSESIEILRLPEFLEDGFREYLLHPSIIDAALRAITWVGGADSYKRLALHIPFALGQLEIFGPLTQKCYSYAAIVPETRGNDSSARRFNISILNEEGEELVRIKEFTIRPYKGGNQQVSRNEKDPMLYYNTVWEKAPISTARNNNIKNVVLFGNTQTEADSLTNELKSRFAGFENMIFVSKGSGFKPSKNNRYTLDITNPSDYKRLFTELHENGITPDAIVHTWNTADEHAELSGSSDIKKIESSIREDLNKGIYSILYTFQAVTALGFEKRTRCISILPGKMEAAAPQFSMLGGLAKSLTTVNYKFELAMLYTEGDFGSIAGHVTDEMAVLSNSNGKEISYFNGERFTKNIHAVENLSQAESNEAMLKDEGVYLITGGAGELGMVLAEHLTKHYGAGVVLTGRSALSPEKENKINALGKNGLGSLYVQADISSYDEAVKAIKAAKEKFGKLNGIIHCAGVLNEVPIMDADKQTYEKAYAPKVNGTINLDIASRDEELDFFVLFSSISAIIGDFGRGAYSSANSFMDGYALMREHLRKESRRKGKTISINWPLWKNGGMKVSEEEGKLYFEYSGMLELDSDIGMKSFEKILGSNFSRLIVVSGDTEKINRTLGVVGEATVKRAEDIKPEIKEGNKVEIGQVSNDKLFMETEKYLKEVLSKATSTSVNKIDSRADFSKYGIDSIMIMDLNNILEKDFESLPRTLFFEYSNLLDLTNYFVTNHADRIRELKGISANEAPESRQHANVEAHKAVAETNSRQRFINNVKVEPVKEKARATVQNDEDIAIIGLSGKYPMAKTLDEFWNNLKSGRDCITEVPSSIWDYSKYFDPQKGKKNKVYCKWGAFMEDTDKFDPLFFHISPREAELIDPQERLFLEAAYHTLEDAGYAKKGLSSSKVGVYVGVMNGHYQLFGVEEYFKGNLVDVRSSYSSIANRVSYYFDFKGPSIAIDTMCSASLTAIHLACESIRKGESDLALAGGVNVIIHPAKYIFLSEQKFGSSEGKCRAYGENGDGYVPGEGVGSVLLKPLSKAIADGDRVYAVIKATSINHGGRTNGYTVPNPNAQGDLIADALVRAGIDPRTISYIEGHGTGTALGDPIEIAGLSKAFKEYTKDKKYCAIGSVKSNIGHLESAAGIASLTKVLLQMQHKQLAPSILAERLNPNINFEDSPFYVQRELSDWKQPTIMENGIEKVYPRRAGISSFGAGGSNAHLIVEEYQMPLDNEKPKSQEPCIVVLSARNEERLTIHTQQMIDFLRKNKLSSCNEPENNSGALKAMEESVIDIVSEVLNIPQKDIDVNESIYEYGFDKVALGRLSEKLSEKYENEIPVSVFDVHKTIDSIARYLYKNFGGNPAVVSKKNDGSTVGEKAGYALKLADIAYTLQVGREEFDERLAIIANSIDELLEKLEAYSRKEQNIRNLFRGSLKQNTVTSLLEGDEGKEFANNIVSKKDCEKICQLWLLGADIDWEFLYEGNAPKRISLPNYPFEKKRYWIKKDGDFKLEKVAAQTQEPSLSILAEANDKPLLTNEKLNRYLDGFEMLEKLGEALLFHNIKSMGAFRDDNESYFKDELLKKLRITEKYHRLFDAFIDILSRDGVLQSGYNNTVSLGERGKAMSTLGVSDLDSMKQMLIAACPELSNHANVLWTCMNRYPEILRGEVPATDVMFPNSSMDLVKDIYRGHTAADFHNSLIAWSVRTYIESKLPLLGAGEKIRILEVGAGTGSSSAFVFDGIRKYGERLNYVYTDVSTGFTQYGKKQFGSANPYVEFKIINIENDAVQQGYEPGTYDVVIATNVLHATRSISNTLKNIRLLLKEKGWVVINEITDVMNFTTLTFGLLDGWWLYEDEEVRLNWSPVLDLSNWEKLLKGAGFGQVTAYSQGGADGRSMKQHVILAENASVVNRDINTRNTNKPVIHAVEAAGFYSGYDAGVKNIARASQVNLQSNEERKRQYVEQAVIGALCSVVNLEAHNIDVTTPYSEYGVDSILSVEIVNIINKELGINLKTTVLFDYSTITNLCDYIIKSFNLEIELDGDKEAALFAAMLEAAASQEEFSQEEGWAMDGNTYQPESDEDIVDHESLWGYIEAKVSDILSDVTQAERDQIDTGVAFKDYGVESILAEELINRINKALNIKLLSTDLFNYSTIAELTGYIMDRFGADIKTAGLPKAQKKKPKVVGNDILDIFKRLESGELDLDELEF